MVAQPFGCNPAEGGSAQGGAGPLYARTGVFQNGFRSRIADAEGRLDAKGRAMHHRHAFAVQQIAAQLLVAVDLRAVRRGLAYQAGTVGIDVRSEEHTSELQSLMRISYADF